MQWNRTATEQLSAVSTIQPSRSAQCRRSMAKVLALVLFSFLTSLSASAADKAREQVVKIVAQIQRADYEDDRASLQRLFAALAPFAENKQLASRVRYWRGFALWRRAINGANDNVAAKELEEDIDQALSEFDVSAKLDQDFVEAKIAALSCLGYLAFLHRTDQAQLQNYLARFSPLRKDLQATSPDNPRLCWVLGPMYWNVPETGGPAKAIASYQQGLATIRMAKTAAASDPLNPSWGEPELLMSLAWASLNGPAPDSAAAEQYARSALALVPYWHYLKDVLMPQIQTVRAARN